MAVRSGRSDGYTGAVLFMTGCTSGLTGSLSQSSSHFDNYTSEQTDSVYTAKGSLYQEDDGNAVLIFIHAENDAAVSVTGTLKRKSGADTRLVYTAPDGTETKITENSNETIDATLNIVPGEGTVKFLGKHAVYDFEVQFGLADGVSYSNFPDRAESGEIESVVSDLPASGWPGEEAEDRIIRKIYGDEFHRAYSMNDVAATTDSDNFTCDYSKLDIVLNGNCVLLAQESGDNTERTVKYDINVASGECAVKYDNDEGESVVIWSGTGRADGSAVIKLGEGANCLRLEAQNGDAKLKIKLQCTK